MLLSGLILCLNFSEVSFDANWRKWFRAAQHLDFRPDVKDPERLKELVERLSSAEPNEERELRLSDIFFQLGEYDKALAHLDNFGKTNDDEVIYWRKVIIYSSKYKESLRLEDLGNAIKYADIYIECLEKKKEIDISQLLVVKMTKVTLLHKAKDLVNGPTAAKSLVSDLIHLHNRYWTYSREARRKGKHANHVRYANTADLIRREVFNNTFRVMMDFFGVSERYVLGEIRFETIMHKVFDGDTRAVIMTIFEDSGFSSSASEIRHLPIPYKQRYREE